MKTVTMMKNRPLLPKLLYDQRKRPRNHASVTALLFVHVLTTKRTVKAYVNIFADDGDASAADDDEEQSTSSHVTLRPRKTPKKPILCISPFFVHVIFSAKVMVKVSLNICR